MALVSICVLPNHATFMTDTLDATFMTSISDSGRPIFRLDIAKWRR